MSKKNIYDIQKGDLPPELLENFEIPSGPITPAVAEIVMNVYKQGGHLSFKSVHKILRIGYKLLTALPNTTKVAVASTDRLTVVGDIHGQLPDLIHILEDSGFPSVTNKYIFNGDFVDRGPKGVEVMCLLLALFSAFPLGTVVLNRGNHEDYAICCAYGFQTECVEKYDEITFGMFVEVFSYLPLFAIINDAVLVVHGGIFHTQDALLSELNAINRADFSLRDMPDGGEKLDEIPRFRREAYLKQLARDALWSDPMDKPGIQVNIRGAGVAFGPDRVKTFLDVNKLKMIVRSHECIGTGFDHPFCGGNADMLVTIFSASNYGGGGNSGAYMVFTTEPVLRNGLIPKKDSSTELPTELERSLIQRSPSKDSDNGSNRGGSPVSSRGSSRGGSPTNISKSHDSESEKDCGSPRDPETIGGEAKAAICTHESTEELADRFMCPLNKVRDTELYYSTYYYDIAFSDDEINVDMNYDSDYEESLMMAQAGPVRGDMRGEMREEKDGIVNEINDDDINHNGAAYATNADEEIDEQEKKAMGGAVVDSLYANHEQLAQVFRFFDQENSGIITQQEFRSGCEEINNILPTDEKMKNFDKVLEIFDVNGDGTIDLNSFFELFRLTDIHTNYLLSTSLNPSTVVSSQTTSPITPAQGALSIAVDSDGQLIDVPSRRPSLSIAPTSVSSSPKGTHRSSSHKSASPKGVIHKSSGDHWRMIRRNVESTPHSRVERSKGLTSSGSMSNVVMSVRGMEHYSKESSSRRMTRLRSLSVEQQSIITANDEAFMVLSQPQTLDSSNHDAATKVKTSLDSSNHGPPDEAPKLVMNAFSVGSEDSLDYSLHGRHRDGDLPDDLPDASPYAKMYSGKHLSSSKNL